MADHLSPQELREKHTFTVAPPKTHVPRIMPLVIGIVAALAIGALAYVALEAFFAVPDEPAVGVEPPPAETIAPSDAVESRLG
jgi:hypothetical protein